MSEELILRTENVCKSFNGIQVLKNVNLGIRKGEIHALMGENGAGKSTIIKIITGVYTKDEGEIYINGRHVNIIPVMTRLPPVYPSFIRSLSCS